MSRSGGTRARTEVEALPKPRVTRWNRNGPGDGASPETPATARANSTPFLIPLLGPRAEAALRALTFCWFVAAVWFWAWWTAAPRGPWNVERVVASGALAWVFLLSGYFLFFACRMTRPNPRVAVPNLRVAMVVTKAPSEPWNVVVRTLTGMLNQDFPHCFDVWLADEQPTDQVREWCAEHGVSLLSRQGVRGYHEAQWPRRTRCKEGNLAYFYDQVGYERYDVVAQLDADHVPEPTYLTEIVRPFANPNVGYVAAPSLCDANADAGWTVRGRLFREASTHGPVQAGSNGGWAPVCIGSHYAVRTAALRDVGGLGPELAEDYSTTLWLQAAGWDGVFAIDAEAHGDGPETVNDMLLQETQWSRSLGTILVRWAPSRLRRTPRRARARLSFALLFYAVQGLLLTVGVLLPSVGLLTQTTWATASLSGFYVHIWLCAVFPFAAMALLRHQGVLRPRRAKLFSYEVFMFQLIRWPWTAIGFAQGMRAGLRRTSAPIKVTPKGRGRRQPLRLVYLAPALIIGIIPAVTVAVVKPTGQNIGLYLLCIVQASIYLAGVVAIYVSEKHLRRQEVRSVRHRNVDKPVLVVFAFLFPVLVATALILRIPSSGGVPHPLAHKVIPARTANTTRAAVRSPAPPAEPVVGIGPTSADGVTVTVGAPSFDVKVVAFAVPSSVLVTSGTQEQPLYSGVLGPTTNLVFEDSGTLTVSTSSPQARVYLYEGTRFIGFYFPGTGPFTFTLITAPNFHLREN